MRVSDPSLVLDLDHLKDITLDDDELMREVVSALIDDTSRQLSLLDAAIRGQDRQRCMKLAHYSKGACATVGANRAAERLKQLEHDAASSAFDKCLEGLEVLLQELDQLRQEGKAL